LVGIFSITTGFQPVVIEFYCGGLQMGVLLRIRVSPTESTLRSSARKTAIFGSPERNRYRLQQNASISNQLATGFFRLVRRLFFATPSLYIRSAIIGFFPVCSRNPSLPGLSKNAKWRGSAGGRNASTRSMKKAS
jgi:hypothetical protein